MPPQRLMYITINRARYRKCRDFTEVMPLLKRSRSAKKLESFAMYTARIRGKKVAVIGHFPNFQKKRESICELSILEMQPEWGDYPAKAAEFLLPQQDFVFMTGATFANKTMPRLLELSKDAVTVLVGSSVPMHPCLFKESLIK